MQTTKILLSAILVSTTASHARLKENLDQCDSRYGKPIYQHSQDDMEYRSYKLSGRRIQVVFHKKVSAMEMITTELESVYSEEQVSKFGAESIKFIRGLLSSAYGFSEEQLVDLTKFRRKSAEVTSSMATNGSIRAGCSIESNQEQTSAKVVATLIDTGAAKEIRRIIDFGANAVVLEAKGNETKAAEGF